MNHSSKKYAYTSPVIQQIILDREISLILNSYPDDPGDMGYHNTMSASPLNDPFQIG